MIIFYRNRIKRQERELEDPNYKIMNMGKLDYASISNRNNLNNYSISYNDYSGIDMENRIDKVMKRSDDLIKNYKKEFQLNATTT